MTNTTARATEIAQALIENGYSIVPLPHGRKGPIIKDWNIRDFCVLDFSQNDGVGIKTGHGVVALDVDVYDRGVVEDIVAEFERRFGPTLRRTGRAPKTALLVRCAVRKKVVVKLRPSGFAPVNDKGETKPEQVEVLTDGQQLVAFGTHPDTGAPYHWHDREPWGDGNSAAAVLPSISNDQLDEFLDFIRTEYGVIEAGPLDGSGRGTIGRPGVSSTASPNVFPGRKPSLDEAREILSHVPTPSGYDEWWRIYVGIKWLGDEYFQVADAWSAKGVGYHAEKNRRIWDSSKEDGGITFATVAAAARANGADLAAIARKYIGGTSPTVSAVNGFSARAQKHADLINCGMKTIFAACDVDMPSNLSPADPLVFQRIYSGVFFSGAKSKFFLLNRDENLNQHTERDATRFIRRQFGKVFDFAKAKSALQDGGANEKTLALIDAVEVRAEKAILDEIKFANQRERVEWFEDMFSSCSRIELKDDIARVVVTHRPYEAGPYDQVVIDDFRDHFPELDVFLHWLAASRFAMDRKLAYLWLLLPSDFGKGLMMGQLKALGAVVEMSVKEIEAAFEGKPLARSPEDFRRAIIVWVDEFKSVKSELKQLQSQMSIAPKYQLSSTVQLYAKVFTSAESVASLVSEHGVEDQFANRMSIITGTGSVVERPLFQEDHVRYAHSLKNYMAETLNRHVATFVALGPDAAALNAGKVLKDFAARYGLGRFAGRVSDAVPELAEEFRSYATKSLPGILITRHSDGAQFLRSPNKAIADWLERRVSKPEFHTLIRRAPEIIKVLSVDGRGVQSYANGNDRFKAVRIA